MARVSLVDVSKCYADGRPVIADLNLEIADGEFMVLIGPSGSGKSTALNMIAGLEDVSSGEIWIGDRLVNQLAPRDRDVAMVFQSYALYPHMTVRENMSFALRLAKLGKPEIERRIGEAAAALELEELLERKPDQLSGGQRQRVAMGRAIVREPQAFLMDEPLSNLDAKLRVQTREQIAQLQQRLGVTTVYVTHDQTEALTLGDRIAVLDGGRLQQVGTRDELYLRPANLFVAGFIGSPAMNLVAGTVSDGVVELPFGRLPLPGRLKPAVERLAGARKVIVGVRPEDLEPVGHGTDGLYFDAVVEVVESTGADLYAHVRVDGARRMVARLDPETGARPGMRMTLGAESAHMYLFDATSGTALSGAVAQPPRSVIAA